MTAPERLEHDLPQLLAQLAAGPRPDYRDSLVEAIARTPQRPAWTFPGRWLPMDIAAQRVRPASALRVPVLFLLLAGLLAAALVALAVASRQDLPAPYGPASNGAIVYGSNGDLFALASEEASPSLLVGGAPRDRDPDFAPRGDRLLFLRDSPSGATALMVMAADGSGLRELIPPTVGLEGPSWSADGSRIAFSHRPAGLPTVSIVDVDTGTIRDLALDRQADPPILWRPGHDDQLLFRAATDDGHRVPALVDLVTGAVTLLDIPAEDGAPLQFDAQRVTWSPDGRRLVLEVGRGLELRASVPVIFQKVADVAADGTVTSVRPFVHDPSADYEYFATFTPDGTSVLFASQKGCVFQAWLAPVDDPRAAVAVGPPTTGDAATCTTSGIAPLISPDGTRVLIAKGDGMAEDVLFVGGTDDGGARPMNLTTDGWVAWQRVRP
jgi:hypothetical protein